MDLIERPVGVLPDSRRHPWEVARARLLVRLIDQLGLLSSTANWLDVGAGDAWFASQLRAAVPADSRIVCWDSFYSADEVSPVCAPGPGISFTSERPDETFGGLLMLDVIEHVADDAGFVRDVVEGSLAEDGRVLVTVPAYQALFSEHDRVLRHYRRYSPRSLRSLLECSGLEVLSRGGLFHGLLPLRGAQVMRERVGRHVPARSGIGEWQGEERLSRALVRALELEGTVSLKIGRSGLPVLPGLTTWAYCRRAGERG